jgi:signal transduction histidine kinase
MAFAFVPSDPTASNADLPIGIAGALGAVAFAVLGALIVSRTGNRIGWTYLAIIGVATFAVAVGNYAALALTHDWPFLTLAALLSQPLFLGGLGLFVAIFYLFPTGELPSPSWRWIWRGYLIAVAVIVVGFAILDQPIELNTGSIPNPIGIVPPDGPFGPVLMTAGLGILVAGALGLLSLVFRFRKGDQTERQQIRWLMASGSVAGVALVVAAGAGIPADAQVAAGKTPSSILVLINAIGLFVLVASIMIGIPLATTIAILKYRLYELDLVVRKTVVFTVLAGFVTVVYVGVVVLLTRIVGSGSVLSSIAATALVAGLFQPVRRWATKLANRLVFGRRAEPYEVLSTFSDRIGSTYAAEDVLPRMARVIAEGMAADRVEVWLAHGETARLAAAWPVEGVALAGEVYEVPIRYREEMLGQIRVGESAADPLTPPEDKLLRDLASQAGLVLRNVGLTVDLQARVEQLDERAAELRASRARIVEAHDAERRRLERNIHDGAQQHLVALAVKLRLARSVAQRDPEEGAVTLRTLADETGAARATLLDLASGIYPMVLEERGIGPALEEQARAGGVPIVVATDGLARLPIETEAAVYFVCLEAMQNAAKYAHAGRIEVRLGARGGHLSFEVTDDGEGFDAVTAASGSGLRNMRDRLSAFGGDVRIDSTPGRGTSVRGSLPLAEVRR